MHWSARDVWMTGGALVALLVTCGTAVDAKADCVSDGRVKIAVKLTPPAGKDLAGVKVVVDYPEKSVGIPGIQNLPEVKERVADLPANFLSAPNDTDSELILGIAGTSVLPAGTIFTADFDRCKGAEVHATDFHCQVPDASTPKGELIDGATCQVEIVSGGAKSSNDNENAKLKGGDSK